MPPFTRTKIVVTLGPSSWKADVISQLIEAGTDVFRINMSHAKPPEARALIERIRGISDVVAVLIDTKGPELRTTNVLGDPELLEGEELVLRCGTASDLSTAAQIYVRHPDLPRHLTVGGRVFLDDGLLRLVVRSIASDGLSCRCRVERGGPLTSRRGVNVPGVNCFLDELTPEDVEAIKMAGEERVDFVAASFVQTPDDVRRIRELLDASGSPLTAIIAKVETEQATTHLSDIISVSDGIMVARGDLGVEVPAEEVPLLQKRMVRACNVAGKPVIVATQMLESMIEHPIPTRAETSDVANAIIDGTDAVMLSGETAKGRYPVEAVNTLLSISDHVEKNADLFRQKLWMEPAVSTTDFVAKSVCNAANDLDIEYIVALTSGGRTARLVSSYKPPVAILATTPNPATARKLALTYGVLPFVIPHSGTASEAVERSLSLLLNRGILRPESRIVLTYGVPMAIAGTTNMLATDTVATLLAGVRQG